MYPLAETSCGQVCYYFGQVDHWSNTPVPAETSGGQMLLLFQVDLWSDVPPAETTCGKVFTTSVRLTSGQMYPPEDEASGQVDIKHLVRLQVKLTFGSFPYHFLFVIRIVVPRK